MNLFKYENILLKQGYKNIAGVDEVGLGSIAGPVVAAAVVLDLEKIKQVKVPLQMKRKTKLVKINDSKQLTRTEREILLPVILTNCIGLGIGVVDVYEINDIRNIRECGYLARFRACNDLNDYMTCYNRQVDFILIDGNFGMPETSILNRSIIGGDSKSVSIAAASIVAKVYHDNIMIELHKEFPMYDWEHNMGYRSKKHFEGIKTYGLSKYHRMHLFQEKNSIKESDIRV